MRNPIYLLSSLQTHSTDRSYSYERLYRNLYNKELFLLAYQNIYASQGEYDARHRWENHRRNEPESH